MFKDLYVLHFRNIVHIIQRSSFYTARFISWDEETKRATFRNGRGYRLFQMVYASFTFPILPLLVFQSFKVSVEEGLHDRQTIILAYLFTLSIWTFVPYSWVLMRYSEASKLIQIAEATSNLDKQFTGTQN